MRIPQRLSNIIANPKNKTPQSNFATFGRDYQKTTLQIRNKEIRINEKTYLSALTSRVNTSKVSFYGTPEHCSDQILKKVCHLIKSIKALKKLEIQCFSCHSLTDISVKLIGKALKCLKSLEYVKFSFEGCEGLTNQGIQSLCESLRNITHIKSLELHFGVLNEENITEASVPALSRTIKRLDQLRCLSVALNGDHLKDKGLQCLMKGFNNLFSLQSLRLDYEGFGKICQKNLEKLLKTLQRLPYFKNLALILSDEMSTKTLEALGNILKNDFLNSLEIEFIRCHGLTSKNLESLNQSFQEMSSLETLQLAFYNCPNMTDEALQALFKGFEKLKFLRGLSFRIEESRKISDQGIQVLSESLQNLTSLTSLRLKLQTCRKITSIGLEYLGECLKTLESLEILQIKLKNCMKISDYGLKTLSEGLSSIKSLKDFNLNLSACKDISDEGVISLSNSLKNLHYLNHLNLHFNHCFLIEDEGVNTLYEAIKNFQSLLSLKINFYYCPRITDKGFENFDKCFGGGGLKLLKSLQLKFQFCLKLTDECLGVISRALNTNKTLKCISLAFEGCKEMTKIGIQALLMKLNDIL